jgi:hypothetical protein
MQRVKRQHTVKGPTQYRASVLPLRVTCCEVGIRNSFRNSNTIKSYTRTKINAAFKRIIDELNTPAPLIHRKSSMGSFCSGLSKFLKGGSLFIYPIKNSIAKILNNMQLLKDTCALQCGMSASKMLAFWHAQLYTECNIKRPSLGPTSNRISPVTIVLSYHAPQVPISTNRRSGTDLRLE